MFTTKGTILTQYIGMGGTVVIPDGITEIGSLLCHSNHTVDANISLRRPVTDGTDL